MVVRKDAGIISEGRAWIWNSSIPIDIGTDTTVCEGNTTFSVDGSSLTPEFEYFNPPPLPLVIDSSTIINISFSATHTWVSDLGFYIKTPDGDIIVLGPNQGNICNSGYDVSNLVFTNQSAGVFDFCVQPAPLTGVYNQYFDGVNTQVIDWTPTYGENANSAGWAAMIFDCVGADVGALTNVSISFNFGGGTIVTLNSGAISSPINDNSCDASSASIFQVPFTNAVSANTSLTIGGGSGTSDIMQAGYEWFFSTSSNSGPWTSFENNSTTPSLNLTQDTWIRLKMNNGLGCSNESIVKYTVESVNTPTATTTVTYTVGDTATALTATSGGTGLLWYSTETAGTGSTTAPTPDTSAAGSTSYWVASTNANGCESERVEVVVEVNAAATHLNFDGVDDYVNLGASLNTTLDPLNTITVESWVKPATNTGLGVIVGNYANPLGSQMQFLLRRDGTSYTFWINGTSGIFKVVEAINTVQLNTWQHVAGVWNGTDLKIYVNGVLSGTTTNVTDSSFVTSTNSTFIGNNQAGSPEIFTGDIDEVRIWNIARSQTDINNLKDCEAMSQPELIAYYKFNQGYDGVSNTGITSLTDSAGSNNGTLTNFALSGATSNWKSGSPVTTGNTCTTLDNPSFEAVSNLKVYPNPSTGIFTIAAQENVTIEVYDIVGKVVAKKALNIGENSIDISNYENGMYLLKATNALGNVNTYKIIKQ